MLSHDQTFAQTLCHLHKRRHPVRTAARSDAAQTQDHSL